MSGTSVTAAARPADTGAPRRRHRGALAWSAGAGVSAAVLFGCYLRQSRTVAVGSDGASQALQAWDLLHGNLLLHGWWVTDVSFYTTELPQYALVELAAGLTADVIHVAGALTYTLLVLAAALLAQGRESGPAGRRRALLTAGIMLAPQLGPGTQTLLLSPDHTGTCVPVLLIFLLIDRAFPPPSKRVRAASRRLGLAGCRTQLAAVRPAVRWLVPVAVWLGLTLTAVADAMTIFIAVIPLAVGCAARLVPAAGLVPAARLIRAGRPGTAGRRLAAGWPEAPLAVAALLAVPAELAVTRLIRAHGGWQANGLHTALAAAGQLAGNARLTGAGLVELFGANVFTAPAGFATAVAAAHLAGLALAAAGVAAAARACLRGRELVELVLLAGIVIDLAAYLAGVQAVDILSAREIVPVLPFAAVLAGRLLGDSLLGNRRAAPTQPPRRTSRQALRTGLRAGLAAAFIMYTAGLGYGAAQPAAAPQSAGLAGWLRAHHLTAGLSGYHQANIVTLDSGRAVTLRPVTNGRGGRLIPYTWNASTDWFDPARHRATFLVTVAPGGAGARGEAAGPTAAEAAATFGRPARSYQFQQYTVLVWPPGSNLLTSLRAGQSGPPPAPKQG